ncbi:hypothetical protein SLA2020_092860 [Shorea laevis]
MKILSNNVKGLGQFKKNVKGLGGNKKRRELREMIVKEKYDVVFIQETKLYSSDERLGRIIWGSSEFDWIVKLAIKNSGGILCLWNQNSIKVQNKFEGFGSYGFAGLWGSKEVLYVVINMYALCN